MQDFRNLDAWHKAHALTIDVHKTLANQAGGLASTIAIVKGIALDSWLSRRGMREGLTPGVGAVRWHVHRLLFWGGVLGVARPWPGILRPCRPWSDNRLGRRGPETCACLLVPTSQISEPQSL